MVCPGGWGEHPQDARISCLLPGIARLTQTSCMLPRTSCSNPAPRQPPPRRLVQIDFATGDRQGEFTRYYFPVEAFDCTGSIKLGDVTRLQVGTPGGRETGCRCLGSVRLAAGRHRHPLPCCQRQSGAACALHPWHPRCASFPPPAVGEQGRECSPVREGREGGHEGVNSGNSGISRCSSCSCSLALELVPCSSIHGKSTKTAVPQSVFASLASTCKPCPLIQRAPPQFFRSCLLSAKPPLTLHPLRMMLQ